MRTIYLIRHAESDQNNTGLLDFDRVLNNNGTQETSVISKKLDDLDFNPGLFVCSPARRTFETSELLNKNTPVLYDSSIYEGSLDDLKSLINLLPNEHQEIAVVGHNPTITHLSNYLTQNPISCMPPCSVVKIDFEVENWNETIQGIGSKIFFITPNES